MFVCDCVSAAASNTPHTPHITRQRVCGSDVVAEVMVVVVTVVVMGGGLVALPLMVLPAAGLLLREP